MLVRNITKDLQYFENQESRAVRVRIAERSRRAEEIQRRRLAGEDVKSERSEHVCLNASIKRDIHNWQRPIDSSKITEIVLYSKPEFVRESND